MQRKQGLWLLTIMMACVIVSSGMTVYNYRRAHTYARMISDIYTGAFLAAMMQMEALETNIDKALLSEDEGQSAALLSRIGSDAAAVQTHLSALPLSHTAMEDALKLCNQLQDYAVTLQQKAMSTIDGESAQILQQLSDTCGQLLEQLQTAYAQMQEGNIRLDASRTYMLDADSAARPIESVGEIIEYPTLIYDGPFSDVVSENAPRGLGARQVTREEAAGIACAYVGEDIAKAHLTQESGGAIPAWGVEIEQEDCTLQLAITKQGGNVLWMFPENADFSLEYGLEDCEKAAEEFLSAHGYGDMDLTFWQIYGGMATLSYAAVQDGVVLYPDLIKVQVRMDTLDIVGVEARHYLTSHTKRENLTPAIGEQEARAAISGRLENVTSRLCLIPQNGREYLCWEFTGEYRGDTYYVYVDAATGQQREIQKLVQTNIGLKAS